MDISQLAGADYAEVELAGETYVAGELTLKEWAPVQAWIKATVPGPLASLASPDFARLPPAVKREVVGEALDRDRMGWPPRVGSQAWFSALDHPGGHAVLLRAILSKHRPDLTRAACQAIADKIGIAEILPAVAAALGIFGPKSPAPARETPTTTATGPGATGAEAAGTTSGTPHSNSSRPVDGPDPNSWI